MLPGSAAFTQILLVLHHGVSLQWWFLLAAFRAGSLLALGCYHLVWEQEICPGQRHLWAEKPWSLVQVSGVGR